MPDRSVAVANAFLAIPGAAGRITPMQLQKLTYIAHGWNYAINGGPLVTEPVEAWLYGPVYRNLYDHAKFFGREPIGRLITPDDESAVRFFLEGMRRDAPPYRADLAPREGQVVQHVWGRYGSLSAARLVELTHQRGTPWDMTYRDGGLNLPISEDLIRSHFEDLAERAEAVGA